VLVEQVKAAYCAYREVAERRGLTRLELVALGGTPERLPPVMAQSSQAGVDAAEVTRIADAVDNNQRFKMLWKE